MASSSSSSSSLPRQVTAVGTMGEMGQLFTVYESNWFCTDCNQENYASRQKCFRCRKYKPKGTQNYVMDPALAAYQAALASGQQAPMTCQWHEAIDPNTYQIYYYNSSTGATQWERPIELGAAPVATGWFGRGKAGSTAALVYQDLNDKYLTRPARKQKDFVDPNKYHTEGMQDYNIWYGKYIGGDRDDGRNKEPATDRCCVIKDAGYTKADSISLAAAGGGDGQQSSQRKDRRFFCLHFARGMCAKGADCVFYHRVPLPRDDAATDELYDCFGRQRHAKHRDDMGGTGSFMKPCRTLFVGNLNKGQYPSPKALEDACWKHFSEWGELENVNVIHRLSIAFPRYRLRTSAEFAKEALDRQALDGGEVLSVKWAHDDPNPVAKEAIEKANKDALTALLLARGINIDTVGADAAGFDYPVDYQLPEVGETDMLTTGAAANTATVAEAASTGGEGVRGVVVVRDDDETEPSGKRVRVEEGGIATAAAVEVKAYPNTDAQYASSASSSLSAAVDVVAPVTDAISDNAPAVEGEKKEEEEWVEMVDPASGAVYYYSRITGETSWGVAADDDDKDTSAEDNDKKEVKETQ